MGYRTFNDRDGVAWEVWDVIPGNTERRASGSSQGPLPDAVLEDRRGVSGDWVGVRPELAKGWLCFRGAGEKRRLAPIPADWDTLSEEALTDLVRSARVSVDHPFSR